jgi:chitin synthase
MVGTIVGPGTIFLMIVGSVCAAFKIDQWTSFILNLVPIILFMIVCLTTKSKTQLMMAQLMSIVYAIVMMVTQ